MQSLAEKLSTHGYVVLTDTWLRDPTVRRSVRSELIHDVQNYREFKTPLPKNEPLVLGGFSALGNPSSFHSPTVRYLRQWCMSTVVPMFRSFIQDIIRDPNLSLEQVIDRVLIRPPKASASPESWHRDVARVPDLADITFGGWVNLDDKTQYFSCAPKTHLLNRDDIKKLRDLPGFSGIPKKDHPKFVKIRDSQGGRVAIPPGCIMVFYERLAHEVVAKKVDHWMYRLFLGWRLTHLDGPLFGNIDQVLMDQGVPLIKSGQTPPMWAKLHWTNWRDKLESWSQKMIQPHLLVRRTVGSGKDKGKVVNVVPQHMSSLNDMQLPLYPAYTEHEKAMHRPNRQWTLLVPGEKTKTTTLRLGNGSQKMSKKPNTKCKFVIESESDDDDDDDDVVVTNVKRHRHIVLDKGVERVLDVLDMCENRVKRS